MFNLERLIRDNIKRVKPYASARDEYKGTEGVFLDANENALGSVTSEDYNRYPDPLQKELKVQLSALKRVSENQIFLGNGSDEAIDLVYRIFCTPGKDNVIVTPPTYGMYEVSAAINDVEVKLVPLTTEFQLQPDKILEAVDINTKIIFLCSPNNPTGNCLLTRDIEKILNGFSGIVIIDEAYIDFAPDKSFMQKLNSYPNLIICQTFSKAWGMAAIRLGMAFASEQIISLFNKIKPPYNVNGITQKIALDALKHLLDKERMVEEILDQREHLIQSLNEIPSVVKV
ncbi:MAG TPA: histidinol-phosphate transaminase, partial [Cytophagaceae bacterium]